MKTKLIIEDIQIKSLDIEINEWMENTPNYPPEIIDIQYRVIEGGYVPGGIERSALILYK